MQTLKLHLLCQDLAKLLLNCSSFQSLVLLINQKIIYKKDDSHNRLCIDLRAVTGSRPVDSQGTYNKTVKPLHHILLFDDGNNTDSLSPGFNLAFSKVANPFF